MNPKDLQLDQAKPTYSPHLLLWDNFDDLQLKAIAYHYDLEIISYRQNLLSRISPNSSFLALHQNLERELKAIRQICNSSNKKVVILRDLDCLITYLQVQPESPITLFWQTLFDARHLESILWILLPYKLAPPMWTERLQRL
jgi:hypothetical protein